MRAHTKFFYSLNALYFIPLCGIALSGLEQSGIGDLSLARSVLPQIALIYILACAAFGLGSGSRGFICGALKGSFAVSGSPDKIACWRIDLSARILTCTLIIAFIVSKVLLIPLGVYHSYAFDEGTMTGGVWTASMALSEALVLVALMFLYSDSRHNVGWFLFISSVNGINLLHGTRVFFIISVLGIFLYLSQRRKLTKLILATIAVTSVFLSYLIFLIRSHVSVDDNTFDMLHVLFPVLAESVFSQISLVEVLSQKAWSLFGAPHWFYADTVLFATPRFLFPEKETYEFISRFSGLSPLGAFSGYAQGLLYFGILFPAFYFALGYAADHLRRRARYNGFDSVLYAYFTSDFLFRIMRDGYIIPIKMLADSVFLLLGLKLLSRAVDLITIGSAKMR